MDDLSKSNRGLLMKYSSQIGWRIILDLDRRPIFLNQHRTDEGRLPVGRSAVMAAFDRTKPKIGRLAKVVQGGASDEWAEARKKSKAIVDYAG